MFYILSIVFQLSGALILLLWAFRCTKKQVVNSYYPSGAIGHPDDNNMCKLRKERIEEIVTDIYRNRCAFGNLCIGYLLAVFAEKTFNDCVIFFFVVVATFFITSLEYYTAAFLAQKNFSEDMQIHSSELEKLGVDMFASDKECEEMLNEIWGE